MISHLPHFLSTHPGIEPQVVTSTIDPRRIGREGFDIAIRRGHDGWPTGMKVRPFLSEWAVPVASPALLRRTPYSTGKGPGSDIPSFIARTRDGDWQEWLALAGVNNFRPIGILRFEHLQFTLQAAVDGLGVALGPSALTAQDIAAGAPGGAFVDTAVDARGLLLRRVGFRQYDRAGICDLARQPGIARFLREKQTDSAWRGAEASQLTGVCRAQRGMPRRTALLHFAP